MGWRDVDPLVRELAEEVLTERQLAAFKLAEDELGYWQVATTLDVSRSTARDLVKVSRSKLERALRQPPVGIHAEGFSER